jgi:hypothetical protein
MKTTFLFAAVILFSFPAIAQQRVIVEKATGNVVDVGDSTLQYDARCFDNLTYSQNPIPAGANIRKYHRDAAGDIVLRSKEELKQGFADEWQKDLIARINGALLAPDLKAVLIEIVKGVKPQGNASEA